MYYIGIDVGGTNLKAGLVDESYQIIAVKKAPLHFQSMDQMGETLARMALELVEESGLSRELFIPLYKTVGIALVVKLGGSLCRDAGESALASVVETAGAVCALIAALPLLRAVLSLLMELMR